MLRAALVVLVLVPAAAAAPLLPQLAAHEAEAEATPEGCRALGGGNFLCEWLAEFTPGGDGVLQWPFPTAGKSVVTVTVTAQQATDATWAWMIHDATENAMLYGPRDAVFYGRELPREDTATLLLPMDPTHEHVLFMESAWTAWSYPSLRAVSYGVRVEVTAAEGRERPEFPAASAEDPHVKDASGDVADAALDVVSLWFEDPLLDDGLVSASLRLSALPSAAPASGDPQNYCYRASWTLLGLTYQLEWLFLWTSDGLESTWQQEARLGRAGPGAVDLPMVVDEETATLSAEFPLTVVGRPRAGDLFANMSATSWRSAESQEGIGDALFTRACTDPPVFAGALEAAEADTANDNARPFAIGGPDVWGPLAGRPLAAAAIVAAPPWYEAPLTGDNLPNTLQVLGALAAAATFLAGFLVVRARRRRLTALLAEVDRAAGLPDAEALSALDALEARFDAMLQSGQLAEAHHAALSARAERAENRILRRKLAQP